VHLPAHLSEGEGGQGHRWDPPPEHLTPAVERASVKPAGACGYPIKKKTQQKSVAALMLKWIQG